MSILCILDFYAHTTIVSYSPQPQLLDNTEKLSFGNNCSSLLYRSIDNKAGRLCYTDNSGIYYKAFFVSNLFPLVIFQSVCHC
jgi:hypothetical protein